MRKRLWLKLFWLMVLTALVFAGCDSSDDDNGGPVAEPSPGPAQTLTVSGQAVDDPVAGADVMVKNLSGRLLGAGVTDAEGFYAVTVLKSDAEAGYSIEVSGGTVADAPFSGTLRADYGPGDDPGAANVTPLTSLVSAAAKNGAGDSALQRRDAAVEMIENIGMVREGEWMKTAPGFVDVGALRPFIAQMGFDEWVQVMAGDLEDGELSDGMMVGFPHAHGGIRDAGLAGGGGEVEMGPGGSFSGRVDAAAPEGAVLQYELVNAPAGMRVDESGEIAYAVPADAPAGSRIPFAVRVSDPETGFGRVVHGAIVIPPEGTVPAVDADGDGYTVSDGDCNDADASIYPGAEEICGDGIDQDCDGADKACPGGPASTWYKDADGDGYSDGTTQDAPEKPEGYGSAESLTRTSGDCNDADAEIHPGAEDICGDGIDQDCDGADAECPGEMITWYKDADGDFYSDGTTKEAVEQPAGYYRAEDLTATSGDCDDAEPTVHPGAVEICGDGIDQDCTGGDEACYTPPAVIDNDGDGYSVSQGDCNDYDRSVHPGADEICGDNIDNNCNGIIDEGCVQPDGTPPEFEGISLASVANADAVFLSWLPAADDRSDGSAIRYRVYAGTTPEFEPAPDLLYDEITDRTEITVTGLTPNTLYHFLVLAADEAGNVSQKRDYKSVKTAETPIEIRESVTLKKPLELDLEPPVADAATGEFVFDGAAAEDFSAGEYIVGKDSEGRGYLRRVESVTTADGKVVVQTVQASMAEVIEPLKMDTVVSLREVEADQAETQGSVQRSRSGDEPVVTRRIASSGGSVQVVQTDYVATGEGGAGGPMARARTPRRFATATDSTGRLELMAETNRKVTPPYGLALQAVANLLDEDGHLVIPQGNVELNLIGLTHPDKTDSSTFGNFNAYFNQDDWKLGWNIGEEHISDKPYIATFSAKSEETGLYTELPVKIYVQGKRKYSTIFDTEQEAGVNVDFGFEPELRTSIDTGWFGGIKEAEIVAAGTFSASIEAFYNFSAEASWEKQKQLFKRTWHLTYTAGPVPVYQTITFTLDGKLTAEAAAAISAGAFAGADARIEVGIRYNPDTEEWEMVKGSEFNRELTFNLGVEGSLFAELRLIPKISVSFYEVATGAFFIEPYLAGSAAAEWITDGDVLRQIVISQYQMTDMSAWLGIDGFFEADLSVWKLELWRMEKTSLFEFRYDLFNLPVLSLEAEGPAADEASLLLTATVKDGTNNPFDPDSASWNAYPRGRFTDQEVLTDPNKPGETIFKAKFLTGRADSYRIFFSGNSRFGLLTRQYSDVEMSVPYANLQGIPQITDAVPGDGKITVEWTADVPEDAIFNLYLASESGVTGDNYDTLSGGQMHENVTSPFELTGLENGTAYYLVMTGVIDEIESDISGEKSATPAPPAAIPPAPEPVTAVAGEGAVTLSWNAVEGADAYNVYMAEETGVTPAGYADLAGGGRITGVSSPYTVEGLVNDVTYYFAVTSVGADGSESETASAEVNATPVAAAVVPLSPGPVTATAGDGKVTLSWDAMANAVSYNIYMAEESGVGSSNYSGLSGGQQIAGISSPYAVEGLTNGTTYYFAVTSVGTDGSESHPESGEVNATPAAAVVGDTIADNSNLGMTFVRVPAGPFQMGSPAGELGRYTDGREDQHPVTIANDFYIMTTEVTQAQWRAVMGTNPSSFTACGDDCPVESVSWDDIQNFIAALNAKDGRTYRLPTEAEWEYAARARSTTAFANGDITETGCGIDPNLDAMGWYCGNANSTTHPVGLKQPNAWGLYDMHGNVWEWVEDEWHSTYDGAPTDGSAWVTGESSNRVIRGGSWDYLARYCRSAARDYAYPTDRYRIIGFRLALSPSR